MDDLRALVRLNEQTRRYHADADADVDRYLFRPQVTVDDYRTYLAGVYGFIVPLESALLMAPGLDEAIDVRARAKSALVVHDLLALGLSMTEINALPQCSSIPTFRDPAAALGWLYVAERPLHASAVVSSHLSTYLRPEMAYASAYLSCYAGQVGAKWRELGEAMDRIAYSAALLDRMVAAAQDGFRTLIRFRTASRRQTGIIRIAG